MSMNPEQSPNALEPTGVKRLNKLPLIIVIAMCSLVFIGLIYAVSNRGAQLRRQREAAAQQAQHTEESGQPIQATQIHFAGPDGDPPQHGIITSVADKPQATTPEENSASAQDPLNTGNDRMTARTGGGQPSQEEKAYEQEKERVRQLKQTMLEEAINAPTGVDFNLQQAGRTGLPASAAGRADGNNRLQNLINTLAGNETSTGDDSNQQAQKGAFLQQQVQSGILPYKRRYFNTPYVLRIGTIIPGIGIFGKNSDLPGQVKATVAQNVYDSATGQHLLIPQGTEIIGTYDSRVSYGQKRIPTGWTRLNFPDGSILDLGLMAGTDKAGYSGEQDLVDNHYARIFGSAFLMSLLSAGYQLSQADDDNENDTQEILAAEMGRQFNQVGSEMIRRNMNIQPTLKIRPGKRFNVFVTKDIVFDAPYIP